MAMIKAVVVLPTHNDARDIRDHLRTVLAQQQKLPSHVRLQVLVIDDNSPNGSGKLIHNLLSFNHNIKLISSNGNGIGAALKQGFAYALGAMGADIVVQMDANTNHNPVLIPVLIMEIMSGKSELAIASRFVKGGSFPENWPLVQLINCWLRNALARAFSGIKTIRDCSSRYRAFSAEALMRSDFIQIKESDDTYPALLLKNAAKKGVAICEIPLRVAAQPLGNSSASLRDLKKLLRRYLAYKWSVVKAFPLILLPLLILFATAAILSNTDLSLTLPTPQRLLSAAITSLSVLLTIQGVISLYWMIYAWEDSTRIEKDKPPKIFAVPNHTFTTIIPARHEETVIADTLQAVTAINYPQHLMETLVVCRTDDAKTISAVSAFINKSRANVRLLLFDDYPINKPHSLNLGLHQARGDVVCVFDAEDQPHPNIFNIINTLFQDRKLHVIQSGVQLMNYRSKWFSLLNVMEYYFWFKSTLHFFAEQGFIPLGGNTVFFRRTVLEAVGGWDENCLTEDAEIGMRLSAMGAKFKVVYSSQHATQEETPHDTRSFIRQRTRWNQGFLQVLMKKHWSRLPGFGQRLLAVYTLLLPQLQTLLFILIPMSVAIAFTLKLPITIALLTTLPLLILLLQLVIYNIGMYEFTREYKKPFYLLLPLKLVLSFLPFQLVLGFSALRAFIRFITGNTIWEKTRHLNSHRVKDFFQEEKYSFEQA